MEKVQNSDEANIRQALPALSAHLKDEFSSVRSAVIANHAIITRTSDSVSNLSKRMYDVFSGRTSLSVNLNESKRISSSIVSERMIAQRISHLCRREQV